MYILGPCGAVLAPPNLVPAADSHCNGGDLHVLLHYVLGLGAFNCASDMLRDAIDGVYLLLSHRPLLRNLSNAKG